MDLNKVQIIGRLTRDPESRTIPNGTPVTNFAVATSRVWKDANGQQQESTEFHDVVAWRKLAEICAQYLSKGRQVYVEGYLQTRSWDAQDGQKKYRTEIVADNMIMLGNKGDVAPAANATPQEAASPQPSPAARVDQQPAVPQETEVIAATDEEIRIEDLPF